MRRIGIRFEDILCLIILIVIGLSAAAIYRTNYVSHVRKSIYEKLPVDKFIDLVDSKEERLWFYIHTSHKGRYEGLSGTDPIQRVYIAKANTCYVYSVKGKRSLRFSDLEGLSPQEMIQKFKSGTLEGFKVTKDEKEYEFSAYSVKDKVQITIKRKDDIKDQNAFIQEVSTDELVENLRIDSQAYDGFFHEASSSDRFLKFHSNGLITPIS